MRNTVDFVASTYRLMSDHSNRDLSVLRGLVKQKRAELRRASMAFEDTFDMPCGYQDAAADKCEHVGREYMQLVHAYLFCRYGQVSKRFAEMVQETLDCSA